MPIIVESSRSNSDLFTTVTGSNSHVVGNLEDLKRLHKALPPYVLLGFTAGTGGFNDVHQVRNVSITAASMRAHPPGPSASKNGRIEVRSRPLAT